MYKGKWYKVIVIQVTRKFFLTMNNGNETRVIITVIIASPLLSYHRLQVKIAGKSMIVDRLERSRIGHSLTLALLLGTVVASTWW